MEIRDRAADMPTDRKTTRQKPDGQTGERNERQRGSNTEEREREEKKTQTGERERRK